MKVIFGPDDRGAFRSLTQGHGLEPGSVWGQVEVEDLAREVWWQVLLWEGPCSRKKVLPLRWAWEMDDQDLWDQEEALLQGDEVRSHEQALEASYGVRALLEEVCPDVVVACHGNDLGGVWCAYTGEDEWTPVEVLLRDLRAQGYRRVWVICCNPGRQVPVVPEGLVCYYRFGCSNPFFGQGLNEWSWAAGPDHRGQVPLPPACV